jgi:hypothetical protein
MAEKVATRDVENVVDVSIPRDRICHLLGGCMLILKG